MHRGGRHLPGSGLRKTPAPCRGSLAQGHVGGPARLSIPSGMRSPGARAGVFPPPPRGENSPARTEWALGGFPCSWAPPSGSTWEMQAVHPGQSTSSPLNHSVLQTTSPRSPKSDLWEKGCHGPGGTRGR